VPRAIGVGLFIGILVMVPIVQPVLAVLAAVPLRANVPLTAGTTLLTNPVTTPFLLVSALWMGSDMFGFPADLDAVKAMIGSHASFNQWVDWLLSSAAPALVAGLVVLAVLAGGLGYFGAKLGWRLWISYKWRRRRIRHERPF
jgi:uncharacterized protein (DUF2062 family)